MVSTVNIEDFLPLINKLVTRDYNAHGHNSHGRGMLIQYTDGGKCIRLVARDTINGEVVKDSGCAFGFVVKEDNSVKSDKGGYFKAGDILKAASWKAPAKNFIRGNVFNLTENSFIPWAGVDNIRE